uniref:Epithelial cell adhesion molecule n=1 Tax=Cyprinus carpio TaxID=7962 RepID=A0A8C2H4P9_CYPCA
MKVLIALFVVVFVDVVASQFSCNNMRWAKCDGDPCQCSLMFTPAIKQVLDCTKLIPKCYLMKAEMYRARNNLTTRSIGGKPVETAFVDNDGLYDPECENDGRFEAIQCNGTDVCWCVNSAGVRRSDKGDKNIKCEPVETYWVRLELKHKDVAVPLDAAKLRTGIENALLERYKLDKKFVTEIQYDKDGRVIVVDVKKPKKERITDLSLMTYYMEKDVSVVSVSYLTVKRRLVFISVWSKLCGYLTIESKLLYSNTFHFVLAAQRNGDHVLKLLITSLMYPSLRLGCAPC